MEYRKEIDGLRAIAVLSVIFFHAGFQSFSGGFVGVDIFFVISGYLITTIIITQLQEGNFSFLNFYERRARRLLPALFAVISITFLFSWFWIFPNEMRRFSESLVSVPLFLSNAFFFLTTGYFSRHTDLQPLVHTWSLSLEEQYYFIFPLLLAYAWKKGRKFLLHSIFFVSFLSFLVAEFCLGKSTFLHNFSFFLLPARLWEFLIGSLGAIHLFFKKKSQKSNIPFQDNIFSLLGLFLILFSINQFNSETPFPGLYTAIPTIGTLLIILFANQMTTVSKILRNNFLVFMGSISYSLYLWHQPVFALARHRLIDEPSNILFSALTLFCIGLAYLTWKWIETPIRNTNFLSRKFIFYILGIWGLGFIIIGFLGYLNHGFPSRIPPEVSKLLIVDDYHNKFNEARCQIKSGHFVLETCIKGDIEKPPQYALMGDSHAQALVIELSSIFKKNKSSFITYAFPGCPFYTDLPLQKFCSDYQKKALEDANHRGIQTYIIMSRWDSGNNAPVNELKKSDLQAHKKAILELLDRNKIVFLIYPIPTYEVRIPEYMSKNIFFYKGKREPISISYADFFSRTRYFYQEFDSIQHKNLIRIKPDSFFCDTEVMGKCWTEINGVPLYADESHVTNFGVKRLAQEISEKLFLITAPPNPHDLS